REKSFMARSPAGGKEESRWRGVGPAARLASRGLTGLLNPCVKSGTKLFQPYFMNCFNCASPAVPVTHSVAAFLSRVPFSQHCLKIDNKRLFERTHLSGSCKSGSF